MTDRELLEAAAKAAGLKTFGWVRSFLVNGRPRWNPLTDDGDALRLAVKLRLEMSHCEGLGGCPDLNATVWRGLGGLPFSEEGDPYAATRRAIVRAAAALTAPQASES